MDGAGELRILSQVLLPMIRPAIAVVGLFSFLYAWNDFYNPLLCTGNTSGGQTLAVALTSDPPDQRVRLASPDRPDPPHEECP